MKRALLKSLLYLYSCVFSRVRFYKLNQFLYLTSLRGLGMLNFESERISGERVFLFRCLNALQAKPLVIDVGANIGNYSKLIKQIRPDVNLISFEPHPESFQKLKQLSDEIGFVCINSAVGSKSGKLPLYDYNSNFGSEHASLFEGVIEELHGGISNTNIVDVSRLDEYLLKNNIRFVDLLKVDVEGGELEVLKGFSDFLKKDKVAVIQFEFNEMNIVSRVFFRDFLVLMPNFLFFRLLRDGMVRIDDKSTIYNEIFAYQNIVAINKKNLGDKKLKKFW